jgi:hypothetical protein
MVYFWRGVFMIVPTSSSSLKFVFLFILLSALLALWLFFSQGVAREIGGVAVYTLMILVMFRMQSSTLNNKRDKS